MILEAIVTTTSLDGSINVAPMGPHFNIPPGEAIETFELRPFTTSQTFQNVKANGCGVMHVTDDALLFARAAIHKFENQPKTTPAKHIGGAILTDCCRWYEFKTQFVETSGSRATVQCQIVDRGRKRDFFGFNRAKHAVIEAAILATRIDFIPVEAIRQQMKPLRIVVDKTGGADERLAFELLEHFVNDGARLQGNAKACNES